MSGVLPRTWMARTCLDRRCREERHNHRVLPVVFVAFAAALFAQAVLRLRKRGRADLAGWDRIALFALGLGATLFALVGPLDRLADDELLSAHMGQHVVIGDLGPALMVVALR